MFTGNRTIVIPPELIKDPWMFPKFHNLTILNPCGVIM